MPVLSPKGNLRLHAKAFERPTQGRLIESRPYCLNHSRLSYSQRRPLTDQSARVVRPVEQSIMRRATFHCPPTRTRCHILAEAR